MKWWIEDTVVAWAAIGIGAVGSVLATARPAPPLEVESGRQVAAPAPPESAPAPPVEAAPESPGHAPYPLEEWDPSFFAANSLDTSFSITGSYEGNMRFTESGVALELSYAMAQSLGSPGSLRLRSIRLALAERTPDGGWRIVARGSPQVIGLEMANATRWTRLAPLELRLDGMEPVDLLDRWFVIEHELRAGPENGDGDPAWTYVHGDADFVDRWLASMDGC